MKEYKVVVPRLGMLKRIEKMEDLLNQYARQGWVVKQIAVNWSTIIFERDKNR